MRWKRGVLTWKLFSPTAHIFVYTQFNYRYHNIKKHAELGCRVEPSYIFTMATECRLSRRLGNALCRLVRRWWQLRSRLLISQFVSRSYGLLVNYVCHWTGYVYYIANNNTHTILQSPPNSNKHFDSRTLEPRREPRSSKNLAVPCYRLETTSLLSVDVVDSIYCSWSYI